MTKQPKPIRVLSIDGGGMRGLYAARYLAALSDHFAEIRDGQLDIGRGFDLIVGTSTGAIIGCALAKGLDPDCVAELYREHGAHIFPRKLPSGLRWDLLWHMWRRPKYLKAGAMAMQSVLNSTFGETTLGDIWNDRQIAVAIPAVEMSRHRSWVFKTPHLSSRHRRDLDYKLADICLAATAAPLYRSMARLRDPIKRIHQVFVDGGLWANCPVLVSLVEALGLAKDGQEIQIFCLGTCPRPAGDSVSAASLDRGLLEWHFGGEVVNVGLDAQAYAFRHMARFLCDHVNRKCQIISFPQGPAPAKVMKFLDLDETKPAALNALEAQAADDVHETLSRIGNNDDSDGRRLDSLLADIPLVEKTNAQTRLTDGSESKSGTPSRMDRGRGGSND